MVAMGAERFISVSYGCPAVVSSFPEFRPTRLAVLARFWEKERVFSSRSEYRYEVVDPPSYSTLQRALAHTIYNPYETVTGAWQEVGPYSKATVEALVANGLETDDDIIQQWFDGSEVMRLLGAATSYDEVVVAIDAICGGHEVNAESAAFVRRVLGDREP